MTDKLAGVHPTLVNIVGQIKTRMAASGFPMLVTDGVRTVDEQRALYAQGRTEPGRVVTNADGVHHKSNHQPHEDGYGHAVDMCFLDADSQPTWSLTYPWLAYGAVAKSLGCKWGGDWKGALHDLPHIELP